MSGVNKVIIVGRLGKDPEMKYLESGTAVANMSVATSEQWTDKNTGEKKEKTEWHRIVAFDKAAELCGKFLEKGSLAYFEGKLETRKWTDRDNIERYTTEIKLNPFGGVQFLQKSEGQTRQEQPAQTQQPAQAPANKKEDDDIPF